MIGVILWLLLGVLLFLGVLTLIRWFVAADPRTLAIAARTAGIAILAVIAILLVLSGRLAWLLAVLPLILPLIWRRGLWSGGGWTGGRWSGAGSFGGGGPASSGIRTAYLDMQLDHGSGVLDGQVLQGAHAGQRLSQLSLQDVMELLHSLTGMDRKSALLLEAYLDRRFPDWRQAGPAAGGGSAGSGTEETTGAEGGSPPGSDGGAMSRDEALRILGLAPDADTAAIKAAHLRLINSVHPDRGGSPFLAAQVNRARDVLLAGSRDA